MSEELGREPGAVVNHCAGDCEWRNSGRVIVELAKDEGNIPTGTEILRLWREKVGDIPGVKQLGFSGRGGGPGGGPAISLQLIGANIDQVARASRRTGAAHSWL